MPALNSACACAHRPRLLAASLCFARRKLNTTQYVVRETLGSCEQVRFWLDFGRSKVGGLVSSTLSASRSPDAALRPTPIGQ